MLVFANRIALLSIVLVAGCASPAREPQPTFETSAGRPPTPPTPLVQEEDAETAKPWQTYEPVDDKGSAGYRQHHPEEWPRQFVNLFFGGTQSGSGTSFTTGLRYGYYALGDVGFGAVIDYSDRDQTTWVIAPAFFVRPFEQFRITVAPGVEVADGQAELMIRTGFDYAFPISEDLSIVPGVTLDLVSERKNTTSFGVGLQLSF